MTAQNDVKGYKQFQVPVLTIQSAFLRKSRLKKPQSIKKEAQILRDIKNNPRITTKDILAGLNDSGLYWQTLQQTLLRTDIHGR